MNYSNGPTNVPGVYPEPSTGWGLRAPITSITASSSAFTATEGDVSGLSVSVPMISGRVYRISFEGQTQGTAVNTYTALPIHVAGSSIGERIRVHSVANVQQDHSFSLFYTAVSTGNITVKVRCRSGGAGNSIVYAHSSNPSYLVVEDLGPA